MWDPEPGICFQTLHSTLPRPGLGLTVDTLKENSEGFLGGAVVGNPPANAGDTGSSPGLGGSHMTRSK